MSELALKLIAENKAKHARGEDARVLDLGNCGLTEVPEEVGELVWLEDLIISNSWWDNEKKLSQNSGPRNKILDIPAKTLPVELKKLILGGEHGEKWGIQNWRFLEKLINLTNLHLNFSEFSDLQFLENHIKLTSLDLGFNNISDCIFLSNLTNLTSLNLRSNRLSNAQSLENLIGLTSLNLSFNRLSDYGFLSNLTNLIFLDLESNQISNVQFLENLINLTSLNLRSNRLSNAQSLKKLINLSFLNISVNQISDCSFLSNLGNLTSLDLESNQISEFPILPSLTKLVSLDLRFNHIKDVQFLGNLINLNFLDLQQNQISDIRFLENHINLTSLNLGYNNISDYSCLSNLINLTSLDLACLQISDIGFLENLINLTSLDLHVNRIKDCSPISNLINLTSLNLTNNKISDIQFLEKLNSLVSLELNGNEISDTRILSKLVSLTKLDICNNKISNIQFLGSLRGLTKIGLVNNQITSLVPLLYFIKQEKMKIIFEKWYETGDGEINIEDNNLIDPPINVAWKGNAAILQYFAEQEKQQFKNTEIKLILVGNSTAGKTSLSQYLQNRTFTKAQSTTHGILNQQWQPKDREIQVNLWDFGGQEYYHATHRLFLSRNAVYALVWDAQTDKGGIEPTEIHYPNEIQSCSVDIEHFPQKWWLQNIRHYTRESNPPVPVLLVQNKCARDGQQRVSGEFEKPPFNLMPEWLDNHIDLEATADPEHPQHKKWLRQFEAFEEHLLDKLQSQLAHYEFAVYHRDIRDKVRELAAEGVNDMSYSDFEQLCRNIEADASMDLVQIYLGDITGDILYYPNNERLRKRVFLRPDWVCNQIYAILSRKVLEKQGFFDLDWVRESLGESVADTTTTADDFVELLHEFELVFPESDDNGLSTGQLVAPQYLPDTCAKPDKLEAAKEYANLSHAFTLWFPEFLPKSHIARFVAHWGSQAKQRLFWKNGLLFQTEGCTALVERIGEDKIRVELQNGETIKREAAMQRIFQSFYHLEDGQAVFSISLDTMHFVWWRDVEEAIQGQAQQVKSFYSGNNINFIDLQPFFIFTKTHNKSMKEHIRKLLQEAKTKEALEMLVTLVPAASNLLTTFNEAKNRNMLGILGYEMFSQKQNEVTYAALELLKELKEGNAASNTKQTSMFAIIYKEEENAAPNTVSNSSTLGNTITGNNTKKAKKVFISYSKSDKSYLEDFKVQLTSLRRQNLLETWDDTNLIPGQEWDSAIQNELKSADIIVLLVSSNLIATDYIWNIEMKEALARHERREALVIPVIIRTCVWEDAPFGKLNALPEKGKPIDKWENKDEAWAQVVKKIKTVLH